MTEIATPLLATKLFVPLGRPGLVSRPRLMELMRAALDYGLVLISASAGSGKSTLVSDWIRQIRESTPAGWVSLDAGDNDPVRFWDYFIAAVRTMQPTAGHRALSLLHSSQQYPAESSLTALINDLADIHGDSVVVLDDYHLIRTEAIHTGVSFLLEHLPPKMHIVIATRTEPPLPLPSLRARRAMLEIAADDLRFTIEETAALIKDMQNVKLLPEDLSVLNERTEGWAAGITMAAISLGKQKDAHSFVSRFAGSQRYVMEYLVDEVLKRQTDEIRDFLLKTSVLERLTGSLCDNVWGHTDSQTMLDKLERANLFLIPLDESREWYRYHHLFAELLRQQLQLMSGVKEVMLLHQRASQWYEDNGFPDDGVQHALAARDWEKATRIIYEQSEERIKRGEWRTLLGWLEAIPGEILRTHRGLYWRYATVLTINGKLEAAEAAVSYMVTTAGADAGSQGDVAVLQADLAYRLGDLTRAIEFGESALALLPQRDAATRARMSMIIGMAKFYEGLLGDAWSAASNAYDWGRQASDYWVAATSLTYLGLILRARGELHQSVEMYKRAIALAEQSPAAASPQASLAHILYEWNDMDGAARSAQSAVELGEIGGAPGARHAACIDLAYVCLAQGDVAGAQAMMAKADETVGHPMITPTFRANHMAQHAIFALRQNDLDSAREWSDKLSACGAEPSVNLRHVPARMLIAEGRRAAAAEQLRTLGERAAQEGAQGMMIALIVCQALAADSTAQAITFLTEALKMGEREGFIRTFVDEGRALTPLLRLAFAQGITREYAARLLNIIEAEERQSRIRRGEVSATARTNALLSSRELEVLRLLAEGLSNQEIAARLIISLNTTKTHVRHVFDKLDAKDRLQAVTRAKELKLI
jgi:LuxR family transcriptional regulator, maltose regulon positive regulatory protein